jgi:hypothetical protein
MARATISLVLSALSMHFTLLVFDYASGMPHDKETEILATAANRTTRTISINHGDHSD